MYNSSKASILQDKSWSAHNIVLLIMVCEILFINITQKWDLLYIDEVVGCWEFHIALNQIYVLNKTYNFTKL